MSGRAATSYLPGMTTPDPFQIPLAAAETYEARFVPALFAEWAPVLLDAVGLTTGQRLLDVACGTGVVARHAADRVGPGGKVVGVDLSASMLAVAGRVRPDLTWRPGDAAALPFEDHAFDHTVCQMAMMFFPDRGRAVAEMRRVTVPGGRVGLVVPARLEEQPAYRQFVEISVRHAGEDARGLLDTYFCCGDAAWLEQILREAGLSDVQVQTRTGTARFASADDLVVTEVEATPLAERLDRAAYDAIRRDVAAEMQRYVSPEGFPIPLVGQVVTGKA